LSHKKIMSYFNQFYTGAEQAYFPAPAEAGDPGRQRRRRLLAATVVAVSVAAIAMIVVICWLWDGTPAGNLTVVQIPFRKQMYQAVHQAAHEEPFAPPDSEPRRIKRTKPAAEPSETKNTQVQLPANPQLRSILLDNPRVLPPFPTEHNISVGTPRARLVSAFGRPDLSARTLQHERLVETYVYEQQDQATFIKMQDGSVVSTYTGRPQRGRVLPSEPGPDF
jgi:hypothetical protein